MNLFKKIFNQSISDTSQDNFSNPVEEIVRKSVEHLCENIANVDTTALEAEAIYLAAYIYMKDSQKIDFNLDYLPQGLINKIQNKNYTEADKVFMYMCKHYPNKYAKPEYDHGIEGYKMNIKMCPNYESYVRSYFKRAHNIENNNTEYNLFDSPLNCLWRDGNKVIESPTNRKVYYKISDCEFELMIPPYNPLVSGYVQSKGNSTITCISHDKKRTFVFHFNNEYKEHTHLVKIDMYRNDKQDMVSYHK